MASGNAISKQELAAKLIVESELTIEAMAKQVGISPATIYNWRRTPEFQSIVERCRDDYRKRIQSDGIAKRENRVAALGDRWRRLKQIIDERAAVPEMATVPGGKTGLMVHQVKGIGKGEDFQVIDEYVLDAALLRELRDHEKQAAEELGQWLERREVTTIEKPPEKLEALSVEELRTLRELRAKMEQEKTPSGN